MVVFLLTLFTETCTLLAQEKPPKVQELGPMESGEAVSG